MLTYPDDIATLFGTGSLRLRIGTDEELPQPPFLIPVTVEAGSSFATATPLTNDLSTTNSQLIFATIEPQAFPFDFPGDEEEPGHRSIEYPFDAHLFQRADALDGIEGERNAGARR